MGYYTNFELVVPAEIASAVEDAIFDLTGYRFRNGYLNDVKWYNWSVHMRDISAQFPDYLITLHGSGEESDDLWRAYFKNGLSQYAGAIITYDDFDESKLE
jgi:hypothetical protein